MPEDGNSDIDRPDVLVLGSGRWHRERLRAAFRAHGLRCRHGSFRSLRFTSTSDTGIAFEETRQPPRAVVVRAIPGGTFEQITLRLGLLHALERHGVAVVNPPRAIEACVDKAQTSILLDRCDIPTPPFWATEHRETAMRVVRRETAAGHRLVAKPLFGSQGKGVRLVSEPGDVPSAEEVAGVWYLQRFIEQEAGYRDYRVLVIDGRAVAAMCRTHDHWVTNIRQGASPRPWPLEPWLAEPAERAARALGTFFAGVDLIRDREGRPFVLEVNSMPSWHALQSVCDLDIAGYLAERLARQITGKRMR